MKRLAIFTATRGELNAVRRAIPDGMQRLTGHRGFAGRRGQWHVILIQTGVGMAKAKEACRIMLNEQTVDLALSSGFSCALSPSDTGDLLIGTHVVTWGGPNDSAQMSARPVSDSGLKHPPKKRKENVAGQYAASGMLHCTPDVVETALRTAQAAGLPFRAGRFVTVPRVLWRADEKRQVAIETQAIGLDMESWALGVPVADRQVPFAIVRAVSDLLDEDLPVDFNLFLHPAGWPKGTLTCLARPSSLLGLSRLRSQTEIASGRLTTFFQRFLDGLHG